MCFMLFRNLFRGILGVHLFDDALQDAVFAAPNLAISREISQRSGAVGGRWADEVSQVGSRTVAGGQNSFHLLHYML